MSEKVSFTPGPWAVFNPASTASINPSGAAFVIGPTRIQMDRSSGFSIADANLIAAAPNMFSDLVEAAKLLREYEKLHRAKGEAGHIKAERNKAWAEQFEKTIELARGES